MDIKTLNEQLNTFLEENDEANKIFEIGSDSIYLIEEDDTYFVQVETFDWVTKEFNTEEIGDFEDKEEAFDCIDSYICDHVTEEQLRDATFYDKELEELVKHSIVNRVEF